MKILFILFPLVALSFAASVHNHRVESVNAAGCDPSVCAIKNDCRCASTINPQTDSPQLITLTVDEAVAANVVESYWSKLLFNRTNPDGNPISGTFYVPHEYTNYEKVNDLYTRGFEIAVHSITKNPLQSYWKNASLETLTAEFEGQRQIISKFANIPKEDIIGVRTPQFAINGDVTFEAYTQSGLVYDNSWPTRNEIPLYPYTLDYQSTQQCLNTAACPVKSWKGIWVVPIIDIVGKDRECNTLVSCDVEGTADEIAEWLEKNIDAIRAGDSPGNRAPMTLVLNSSWFDFTENAFEALVKVLDYLGTLQDVFLVSNSQVVEYMKKPVPLKEFTTNTYDRSESCTKSVNCALVNKDGNQRYMTSCVPCPKNYPWLGNPLGE